MRFIFTLLFAFFAAQSHAITTQEMLDTVLEVGEDVSQDGNTVRFKYRGVGLFLVFDEGADRMRLMSPIVRVDTVDNVTLFNALEANYHSVLDARYAVSNDMVWSAFMHPLKDLSTDLFKSAISQVAIANATFGNEFTGGELVFPNR
ncbi:MAG: hypothetical protein AAGJ37_04960 [Pseudomonadota bacterium]